jgi:hypothetical protein
LPATAVPKLEAISGVGKNETSIWFHIIILNF